MIFFAKTILFWAENARSKFEKKKSIKSRGRIPLFSATFQRNNETVALKF